MLLTLNINDFPITTIDYEYYYAVCVATSSFSVVIDVLWLETRTTSH